MGTAPEAARERRLELIIFLVFLAVRGLFMVLTANLGLDLDRDNARYDQQSDGILQGNFDLETRFFITAPFYSFTQAFFKLVFGGYWTLAIGAVQLALCALSGVYLRRLALLLFDQRVAWVATAVYAVFPLTLLWVGTKAQDMPFQLALIFALHALILAVRKDDLRSTATAAVLFAITFLTKSHILLFAPFIPLYWWMNASTTSYRKAAHLTLFVSISLASTLPFGLYNLQRHGMYVLSSTGHGGHFLTGHNEDVYRFIVDPPQLGSPEHRRIFNMDYAVMHEIADTLLTLDHKGKQDLYLAKGLEWCRANPDKLVELSLYDLYYFLLPGLNPHHYGFLNWLAMFALSFPLYLFAYAGIGLALRENFRPHSWILGLLLAMVAFSVVFYVQNRFRTITLEPYYIIYGSFAALRLAQRLGLQRRWPVLADPVKA